MRNYLLFLALGLLVNASTSFASRTSINNKVIYGEDDRRLVSELDIESEANLISLSSSVLAQVPTWRISQFNKDDFTIETKSLVQGLNYCPDENYSNYPIVSACTAFLVSEDLILTAGHCLKDKYDCKRQTWILDYNDAGEFLVSNGLISFKNTQGYTCQELVAHSVGVNLDFALVRLDRPILDRKFLKMRTEGKVAPDETFAIIGHPMGLPKMLSSNAKLRENSLPNFFKTNIDAFSGNSGSPVFGLKSGLVEGILIRGEDDFKYDPKASCQRSMRCLNNECRGESVLRTTALPFKKFHN